MTMQSRPLFDGPIVRRALRDAVVKLDPRHMVRNPVMFVVLLGSVLTTLVLVRDVTAGRADTFFTAQLTIWLWFTVLFANFAEAMAEGLMVYPMGGTIDGQRGDHVLLAPPFIVDNVQLDMIVQRLVRAVDSTLANVV